MKAQGFTLLELLAVLAIISVFAMIALPAYQGLIARMESYTTKKHLQEAIRRAKIEARSRHKDVILCPYNTLEQCDRLGQSGVMVYVDNNGNNRRDDNDTMVFRQPLTLRYGVIAMQVSLGRHYIKFMGDNAKPRGHFGSFRYCTQTDNRSLSQQITINMHGLVTARSGNMTQIMC